MVGPIKNMVRAVLRWRQKRVQLGSAQDVHRLLRGAPLGILDVGASGGILPRFRPFKGEINFVGLEPDERSYNDLVTSAEASEFRSYRIVPTGAWSRDQKVEISFTRKPMCSSHFQPNTKFLSQFPDPNRFDVVGSGAVDCQTIDDIFAQAVSSVDFI